MMGRKKKIDKIETAREWRPFNPDVDIPMDPLAEIGPTLSEETIEVTSLDDSFRRTILSRPIDYGASDYYNSWITSTTGGDSNIWSSSTTTLGGRDIYESIEKERKKQLEKEVGNVKIDVIKSSKKEEHIVACQNEEDLSIDNILTTLSAVKARLMYDIAPIHIKEIQCSITPIVKDNIIKANRKLKMYGKKAPIIACFDEYGKRLPDTIEIGDAPGIILKIVDPEEYGKFYYELKAIELYNTNYNYKINNPWGITSTGDFPF